MGRERSGVVKVSECRLASSGRGWAFAERERAAIDAHWTKRRLASPALFNGIVYVLTDYELRQAAFEGVLQPVEFKSFLYWKDMGYPEAGIRDCFGSAILRASDGKVIVARQRSGNLNAGLWYLPGGFIDSRDADARGDIDVAASVAREAVEETGFAARELTREPGAIVTFAGPMISIGIEFHLALDGAGAVERVRRHIRDDPGSELDGVIAAAGREDIAGLAMPPYAEVLLPVLLGGPTGKK